MKIDDKVLTCGCMLFKHDGNCGHVALARATHHQFIENSDKQHAIKTTSPWDSSPYKAVVMESTFSDPPLSGILHPGLGDVDVCDILSEFERGSCLNMASEEPYLHPAKLFAQCEHSFNTKSKLSSPAVRLISVVRTHPSAMDEFDYDKPTEDSGPDVAKESTDSPVAATSSKSIFKTVKRPHPGDFFVSEEIWEQICYSLEFNENILLVGPSGSGKTQVLYRAAAAMDRRLEMFNMGAMSEPRTSLIGNVNLGPDGTHVSDARFVQAFRGDFGPCMILLDELTRAVSGAFNILLPVLDDQRYLALDEHETATVVHRADNVCFASTANVGMEYTGTGALDKALKDRFSTVIEVFFPPTTNEVSILMSRCPGLTRALAAKLVTLADKQRQLTRLENEYSEYISTRMLLAAGLKISRGMDFVRACQGSILNHFSGEGGDESDRTKIAQIIQKT